MARLPGWHRSRVDGHQRTLRGGPSLLAAGIPTTRMPHRSVPHRDILHGGILHGGITYRGITYSREVG